MDDKFSYFLKKVWDPIVGVFNSMYIMGRWIGSENVHLGSKEDRPRQLQRPRILVVLK